MWLKSEAELLLEEDLPAGGSVVVASRAYSYTAGSGRSHLRSWLSHTPCCDHAAMERIADGRFRCRNCGEWLTASHSRGLLALARCDRPIGVDVQCLCDRPGALRWLAGVSGLETATLTHWALAEACLKAVGQAGRPPTQGWATLPASPGTHGRIQMTHGELVDYGVASLEHAVLAWCRLGPDDL